MLYIFIFALIIIIAYAVYARLDKWVEARSNEVPISIIQMGLMRFRGVPIEEVIEALTKTTKARLNITYDQLENHFLQGGRITPVVNALVSAHNAFKQVPAENRPNFDFTTAARIDLAHKDPAEAVRSWVTPRLLTSDIITAVAKDRIQLIMQVRITVRTNFDRYIGGTTEATILARVSEGIISSVGEYDHEYALEHPNEIADKVEEIELQYDKAAYKIISIDIDEIKVGKNIGVELDMERANADKVMAQAVAEQRRSMAVAYEQEMRAKAEEAKSKLLQAESEIPRAIAEAFRTGKLSIMEYYQYKNLKADTDMRESVSKSVLPPATGNKDQQNVNTALLYSNLEDPKTQLPPPQK